MQEKKGAKTRKSAVVEWGRMNPPFRAKDSESADEGQYQQTDGGDDAGHREDGGQTTGRGRGLHTAPSFRLFWSIYCNKKVEKRQESYLGCRPAQTGQPVPYPRLLMLADHSCPHCEQSHHACLLQYGVTSVGFKSPFLVGCHSFAKDGFLNARSLKPTEIFLPEQYGHPPRLRLYMTDSHSCPC